MPIERTAVGTQVLVTLAALVVVMAGLKAAAPVLVPFLLAAFIALLSAPAVIGLTRRGLPEAVAVGLVIVGVIGVLGGLVVVLGRSINAFVEAAPRYQERLDALTVGLLGSLGQLGVTVSAAELKNVANPGAAIGMAGRALGQIAGILSDTFFVILTVIFMLFEVAGFPAKLRKALGDEHADLGRFSRVVDEVKGYVVIKTYVSIATGLAVGIALWIIGVDFPVLWGILAFALNYVPNIGSVIAAVPPVLLATVQLGVGPAAAVATVFVVVNTVVGNVVEPRLMGRRLGLSTLVVFLSLVFWGWMWGPLGMLLSVPLTMVVKILLEHSGQFQGVAVLLGGPVDEKAG